MQDNFLLTTPLAEKLYREVAKSLPLVDYHNHLSIQDIAKNRVYNNIAELWLLSDPYKHRAMRICGVPESHITGDASAKEKFTQWCRIFPQLLGNALYDWSCMEMEWIFQIKDPICEANADKIWDAANAKLALPEFSAQGLLKQFGVEYAAPCAAICDDLEPFSKLSGIAPSLRGDDLIVPTPELIWNLETLTGQNIKSFDDYISAIGIRLAAFNDVECRFSDHALDNGFTYVPEDHNQELRFAQVLAGSTLKPDDRIALTSAVLRAVAKLYAALGWTMQLHIGAQRYTSSRLRNLVGPAGGFAGIGHTVDVVSLTRMLDDMEQAGGLPRTLLFTLNPSDNEVMAILTGSYSEDGVRTKVSQGPAWWWCDHLQGMRETFQNLASFSVLSTFIGMTTDSRSILSMLRHDYYRRALCGWLGEKAAIGEYPSDFELLGSIVRKLSYENIKSILGGDLS